MSFLSLFLAIDDDEMVVVMPIALFFSRSSMIVRADEKEKPSSRIRAIIIRILPREKEKSTSTDCTSFIVSFTGPVTSATEIAFAIFKRLLLLLLLVLDFFLNFKVVGEEMNALVVDIVMDTIFLFVFFYSLVFF